LRYDAELDVWFLGEFDEVRIDSLYARVEKNGKDYIHETIRFDNEDLYYDDGHSGESYPVKIMVDNKKIDRKDFRWGKMYFEIDDCQYDTVAEEVEFIGYPDCNGHNAKVHSFDHRWYASKILSLEDEDLIHALPRIGEYNGFSPTDFLQALIDVDYRVNVLLGREGSVAIYLHAEENGEDFVEQLLLNNGGPDEYDQGWIYYKEELKHIFKRDLGEDINFDNVWRLWWD